MQENPYSPPTAELVLPANSHSTSEVPFFAVSPLKLVLMSIFTCGLYEIYWFYKNWQIFKLREKENIYPFWRALFAVFFCYSLFSEIAEWQKEHDKGQMPAAWLAFGWIITTLSYKLPGAFSLISFASVVFLIPVQKVVNDINRIEAPEHEPNNKIQGMNWVAIVLGGLLFVLGRVNTIDA